MKKRLGRNMTLVGAIIASLSLIIIAYSANILFGIPVEQLKIKK